MRLVAFGANRPMDTHGAFFLFTKERSSTFNTQLFKPLPNLPRAKKMKSVSFDVVSYRFGHFTEATLLELSIFFLYGLKEL